MTANPIYNFNNKTAIVTGAGGGMGKEIVLALSKFGAKVYGIDLKEKPEEVVNGNSVENDNKGVYQGEDVYGEKMESMMTKMMGKLDNLKVNSNGNLA